MAQDPALDTLSTVFNPDQEQEAGYQGLERAQLSGYDPEDIAKALGRQIAQEEAQLGITKASPEQRAVQIMREELDAASWAAQAEYKTAATPAMYNDIVNDRQTQAQTRIITNDLVNSYFGMLKPNEEIIGRLPPDIKLTTAVLAPDTKVIKDRETGDTVLVRAKLPPELLPSTLPNPTYAAKKEIADASGITASQFSVQKAMNDLKNMKGDELATGVENTLLKIAMEATKRSQLLSTQAAVQSGLADATKALQARMDIDAKFPLLSARRGPSEQVKAAQARYNSALAAHEKLLKGMESTDSYLMELKVGAANLTKFEAKRAQREERERELDERQRTSIEAKKEAEALKREQKYNSISSNEVQNFIYANGLQQPTSQKQEDEIKDAILVRRDKDPVYKAMLNMNPDTAKELLVYPDQKVRDATLKILVGKDKQRFEELRNQNVTTTPTIEEFNLRKIVDNPMLIAEHPSTSEEVKKKLNFFKNPGLKLNKQQEQERTELLATGLSQIIQTTNIHKASDAAAWRTTYTQEGSPLKEIINSVISSRKDSKAPFDIVIDTFMTAPVLGADQKPLPVEAKRQILIANIKEVTAQYQGSFLYPDMNPIQLVWIERIKNQANRAAARVGLQTRESEYLQQRTAPRLRQENLPTGAL